MQSPELAGMIDSLPPELVRTLGYESITTGAGFAQSTFFGLLGFALITIAGISWGAAPTAGAEESGQLELTLAHDVGRVRYCLESAAALAVKLITVGAAGYLVVWLVNDPAGLELNAANLLAVSMAWVGLGLLAGTAAFTVGAATDRRALPSERAPRRPSSLPWPDATSSDEPDEGSGGRRKTNSVDALRTPCA
jgi:ABC-2 type transport system permease protein